MRCLPSIALTALAPMLALAGRGQQASRAQIKVVGPSTVQPFTPAVIDADGETVYDNTGETVLFQTGPQSERLEWGKAMLQTTYEDIGRR